MSFDVDVLFKIAAIGIAIALLNQILTKAGREGNAADSAGSAARLLSGTVFGTNRL